MLEDKICLLLKNSLKTDLIFSKKNKAKMLANILLKRFAFTIKASAVSV